jgi:anhydro-N-acetylmuramic acid kinase
MRVLGIMSGTSLDGADYAICGVNSQGRVKLEEHWQIPFPTPLRKTLRAAADGSLNCHGVGQLHHDLGRFYARGAEGKSKGVELAGLHGQTVFHHPDPKGPATFQLGEPAYLARQLNIPVVNNFRAMDLAAGGQGAPLATIFHLNAWGREGSHTAVHNLGGISNVTSILWAKGQAPEILAFDTGPANMPIDLAAAHYSGGKKSFDRDGGMAASGKVNSRALLRMLSHKFLKLPPPKSTGRELFGESFLSKALDWTRGSPPADVLATLTEFTAQSLARSYRDFLPSMPERVILCGGGASNPFLVSRIMAALAQLRGDIRLCPCAELGWPSQAVEPAAFAFLAWLRHKRLTGNIPQTTGAAQAVPLGQITLP